jgi:hypothetical protein
VYQLSEVRIIIRMAGKKSVKIIYEGVPMAFFLIKHFGTSFFLF